MAIEITPAGILAGVLVIGSVAGLATAAILGVRKNGHFWARRWVTKTGFTGGVVEGPVVLDLGEPWAFPNKPRVPTEVAVFDDTELADTAMVEDIRDALTPERRVVGFLPALALGYDGRNAISPERAAQLAAKWRDKYPAIRKSWNEHEADIYEIMAGELGLTLETSPSETLKLPGGVNLTTGKSWADTAPEENDPAFDPLPPGVYWSIDAQNFYGPDGRDMGQSFAEAWWPRMSEFPQR